MSLNQNEKINWMNFWKKYLSVILIVGAVTFSVSLMLPIKYQSNASILITQKDAIGMDAYKEVKSAEFTGKIVGQVILSNAFMEGVVGMDDQAKLLLSAHTNPEDRIKAWRKSIRVDQINDTGVLNISFLAASRESAKSILETVVSLLQNETENYMGNTQTGIKIVNRPYYLQQPAYPRVLENTVFGMLICILIIFLAIQIIPLRFRGFLERKRILKNKKTEANFHFIDNSNQNIKKDNQRLSRLIQIN